MTENQQKVPGARRKTWFCVAQNEAPNSGERGFGVPQGGTMDGGTSNGLREQSATRKWEVTRKVQESDVNFFGTSLNFAQFGPSAHKIRFAGEIEGNGGSLAFTVRLLLL